jgi:hypothetical protein
MTPVGGNFRTGAACAAESSWPVPDSRYAAQMWNFEWQPGHKLSTRLDDDATVIAGNAEGLASLANHLLRLAADHAPPGAHLHLDEFNGLEPGSVEIILERI